MFPASTTLATKKKQTMFPASTILATKKGAASKF
jgi:hypothetical protein